MTRPLNRRNFLKLSAALSAAAYLPLLHGLRIAATWPLPYPHHFFPNPESLLARNFSEFDELLIPAYSVAELIQRSLVQTLAGGSGKAPGRAHDPDGAFSLPYQSAVSAILHRGSPPRSWDELWQSNTAWPDLPRLVVGLALQRRGYSLNDSHPGHLAQIEKDLLAFRPRIVADPIETVRSGRSTFGVALVSPAGGPRDEHVLRYEISVEYDWVIPRGAANAEAALAFISGPAPLRVGDHGLPLTPLPAAARVQVDALWKCVRASAV